VFVYVVCESVWECVRQCAYICVCAYVHVCMCVWACCACYMIAYLSSLFFKFWCCQLLLATGKPRSCMLFSRFLMILTHGLCSSDVCGSPHQLLQRMHQRFIWCLRSPTSIMSRSVLHVPLFIKFSVSYCRICLNHSYAKAAGVLSPLLLCPHC